MLTGFAGGSVSKESACKAGDPGARKIPQRIEWQPTPALLPGKSHGQRSLAGYSSWGGKELDGTEGLTLSLSLSHSSRQASYQWIKIPIDKFPENMSSQSKTRGFPGGASGKESAYQCRRHKRCWFDSLGWEDALEKGLATQSSIFAWRIPRTEEPSGLPSMGSHRVGHD